jgi:thiamine kinase-like enzyme
MGPMPDAAFRAFADPQLIAPSQLAMQRVVTTHADYHCDNLLKTDGGELQAIDFEFSVVSMAVLDIAWFCQMMRWDKANSWGAEHYRVFIRTYLELSGYNPTDSDVDACWLDAELAGACCHCKSRVGCFAGLSFCD